MMIIIIIQTLGKTTSVTMREFLFLFISHTFSYTCLYPELILILISIFDVSDCFMYNTLTAHLSPTSFILLLSYISDE